MEVLNIWEAVLPRLRASIDSGLTIERIAEFCNASDSTVVGWAKHEHPAKGERLLRLWHLLAFVGNDSPELEAMKPLQRFISELFAFGVIDAAQACEILNLTPEKPSYMYHILRGSEVLKPKHTYEELVALFGEELNVHKQVFREDGLEELVGAMVHTDAEPAQPSSTELDPTQSGVVHSTASADVTFGGDPKILLASLVSAIRPVAKALLSNQFTPEDRSDFRDMVTPDVLFEVQNTLEALSSERIRNKR